MAKTKEELKVTPKELDKLKRYNEQLSQLNNAKAHVERGFADALDLIGDRYDVDLINGKYAVLPDGRIVSAETLQKEGAETGPQLLQEGE